jgi:hypothetical protein
MRQDRADRAFFTAQFNPDTLLRGQAVTEFRGGGTGGECPSSQKGKSFSEYSK